MQEAIVRIAQRILIIVIMNSVGLGGISWVLG